MKNSFFISVLYAFISSFLINVSTASATDPQPRCLGWNGSEIIPLDVFTDSTKWECNAGTETGDSCSFKCDSTSLNLYWTFTESDRYKFAQCYIRLDTHKRLANADIFAFDIKGTTCGENRHIRIKFEDGSKQAAFEFENLAAIPRWGERISVLKSQFSNAESIDWDRIKVVSFEVFANKSGPTESKETGVVSFRNLHYASISEWERATAFEELYNKEGYEKIKKDAITAILARQSERGLFYTWKENNTANLYGQGLILKLLSNEGTWYNSQPMDSCAHAAKKLASFLAEHQEPKGFWPREWNLETGNIKRLENDSTIWLGDFPWAITGLQNYYNASGDKSIKNSLDNAKSLLDILIADDGKLETMNPDTETRKNVTSSEAYAAAILALKELGETDKAIKMMKYIDDITWDDTLKYWKEGPTSSRLVLYSNTWLSQLAKNTAYEHKAPDALSLAGKVLFTKGAGEPFGLDGVGPLATWFEGTLTYICTGGPGSQYLMKNLTDHINKDGTVPHYNDTLGIIAGNWIQDWSSVDGTAWLYYAVTNTSPFHITNVESKHNRQGPTGFKLEQNYPNPFNPQTKIVYSLSKSDHVKLTIYDILGHTVRTLINAWQTADSYSVYFDASDLSSGVYFYRLQVGSDFEETKKMLLVR